MTKARDRLQAVEDVSFRCTFRSTVALRTALASAVLPMSPIRFPPIFRLLSGRSPTIFSANASAVESPKLLLLKSMSVSISASFANATPPLSVIEFTLTSSRARLEFRHKHAAKAMRHCH